MLETVAAKEGYIAAENALANRGLKDGYRGGASRRVHQIPPSLRRAYRRPGERGRPSPVRLQYDYVEAGPQALIVKTPAAW